MTKKEHARTARAYEAVAKKYPEVINQRVLELLTRDYIKRRKLTVVALLFLFSVACIALCNLIEFFHPDLALLIQLTGGVGALISVCKFAKYLHDPLTPREAEELSSLEAFEKTGKPNKTSEYDFDSYREYQQVKEQNSSFIKRCFNKVFRISIFIYLIIGICLGFGIKNIVSGADNIATYEERNKNAIAVTAFIYRFEPYTDDEGETWYKVHWKYTYNQEAHTFVDSHYSSSMRIGDTERILIDSKHPDVVIKNNGTTSVLLGSGLCVLGLFILIYSILKARKSEYGVSLLQICWLAFAVAAIAFAIWGIFELVSGKAWGLLPLLLGPPIFGVVAWLFYHAFNENDD